MILRRKYYYKNTGLEIFTINNKSFYLNFKKEKDRENAIFQICKKVDLNQIVDDLRENKDSFRNILGYGNISYIFKKKKKNKIFKKEKNIKLSKILKEWKNWQISNFEFLMWLNILSNRSYKRCLFTI